MLKSFGQRLTALVLTIFCFATIGITLTVVAERKPWGVPDHRRDEYNTILTNLHQESQLKEKYKNASRPIVGTPQVATDFGLLQPGSTERREIEIENLGDEDLQIQLASVSSKFIHADVVQRTIDPGESGIVRIRWDFQPQAELGQQSISLKSNDPLCETIEIGCWATAASELVHPEKIICDPINPGEQVSCEFDILSQVWSDFEVSDIQCDSNGFAWNADQISVKESESTKDGSARSAQQITVGHTHYRYGKYHTPMRVTLKNGEETLVREILLVGRVKSPISFKHPDLHRQTGLSIGTLNSGPSQDFHLQVTLRGEEHRKLAVLDSKPEELKVKMEEAARKGNYRLTISIPENCPDVVFNRSDYRGYVKVGDPQDREFSAWFPLYGAVVSLK